MVVEVRFAENFENVKLYLVKKIEIVDIAGNWVVERFVVEVENANNLFAAEEEATVGFDLVYIDLVSIVEGDLSVEGFALKAETFGDLFVEENDLKTEIVDNSILVEAEVVGNLFDANYDLGMVVVDSSVAVGNLFED